MDTLVSLIVHSSTYDFRVFKAVQPANHHLSQTYASYYLTPFPTIAAYQPTK